MVKAWSRTNTTHVIDQKPPPTVTFRLFCDGIVWRGTDISPVQYLFQMMEHKIPYRPQNSMVRHN